MNLSQPGYRRASCSTFSPTTPRRNTASASLNPPDESTARASVTAGAARWCGLGTSSDEAAALLESCCTLRILRSQTGTDRRSLPGPHRADPRCRARAGMTTTSRTGYSPSPKRVPGVAKQANSEMCLVDAGYKSPDSRRAITSTARLRTAGRSFNFCAARTCRIIRGLRSNRSACRAMKSQ